MASAWIIAAFFFAQSLAFIALAMLAFRRKLLIGGFQFALLCSALSVYSFGSGMSISFRDLSWMTAWNQFIYAGMVWLGPLWLLLALEYAGTRTRDVPWLAAALCVFPALTLVVKYHPSLAHLCYREVFMNRNDFIWTIGYVPGPWHRAHIAYIALTILAGNAAILKVFIQSPIRFRVRAVLMLTASFIPWTMMLIYRSGRFFGGIDITPFGFAATAALFSIGLLRHGMLEQQPITWRRIVEAVNAALVVLDSDDRIIEANPSARRFFGRKGIADWKNAVELRPELEKLDIGTDNASAEFRFPDMNGTTEAKASVAFIRDKDGMANGKTVLLVFRQRQENALREYAPEDAERDAERIIKIMEEKRLHLDPDLTLVSLARKAGIPRNRVSALLNTRFRKNFNDFVNAYRVDEAKRILSASSRSVLEAGFEAGFNSKAAFYAAFKRHARMSPGEYAKKETSSPE